MLHELISSARRLTFRERGATDPILVIAAIAVSLVLLVGGSFAVAGMIANGKNLNAKADLGRVATAEGASSSNGGNYLAWYYTGTAVNVSDSTTVNGKTLDKQDIGFTPTSGNAIDVIVQDAKWLAVVKSGSGKYFYRTSESSKIYETTDPRTAYADGVGYGFWDVTGAAGDYYAE